MVILLLFTQLMNAPVIRNTNLGTKMPKSDATITRKNEDATVKITILTVTERAGSRLPKSSKMLITAEMSTIAQKWLKRLPLKFKDESFGAIKFFQKKFSAEISPEMNRKLTGNDIF